MAVAERALLGGDFALAPINVFALVQRVSGAARVIIGHNDAAAAHIETVHNYETSGRHNFTDGIKRNRAARVEREFTDFMAADEFLSGIALHSLKRRGV